MTPKNFHQPKSIFIFDLRDHVLKGLTHIPSAVRGWLTRAALEALDCKTSSPNEIASDQVARGKSLLRGTGDFCSLKGFSRRGGPDWREIIGVGHVTTIFPAFTHFQDVVFKTYFSSMRWAL
jgi:hypothetical protein